MSVRPFRFGVIAEQVLERDRWIALARRAEDLGYDTLLIRDHLAPDVFGHQMAPLVALAAAAMVTKRIRLGTLVLDNDFRHPAMLAKEAATLDVLSDGRLELGLGAGWLRSEYEQAGLNYEEPSIRIARLDESVCALKAMLGNDEASFRGEHYRIDGLETRPRPIQEPHPPILLGGGKPKMLRLAGREADIVSLLTSSVATGSLKPDPAEVTPDAVRRKIGWVREGAGERFDEIELNMIPTVRITSDRERTADEISRERGWNVSGREVLEMPSIFVGTPEQIVETMSKRRTEYGVTYYVISSDEIETFAPIVHALCTTNDLIDAGVTITNQA